MSILRRVVTAFIVILAVALQSAVIARWNLPGATPDLVLVIVAAFGMKQQAGRAAFLGFAAGLLLDATPPAVGLMGISAMTFAIIGFLAAQLRTDITRSPLGPLAFVAAAAVANVVMQAALGGLLGDATISLTQLPLTAVASAFYCVLLATPIVPLVRGLLRVLMPAPTVYVRR